jgi:hypothetical protein
MDIEFAFRQDESLFEVVTVRGAVRHREVCCCRLDKTGPPYLSR